MKLSIIVPVYNASPYIKDCVESLLNQTIDDYEIIFVNDGSTDNSEEIINFYREKFKDKINLINVKNGGQGRARNIALCAAKGVYIGFCDSDDYVDPNMYKELYNACVLNDADIAICNYYKFDRDNCTVEPAFYHDNKLSCAGAVWNKLFKREFIGDTRFSEGLWYEDFYFSAKLISFTEKISFIDKPLYYYRIDNSSTMRNDNSKKNLDILQVMDDIKSDLSNDKRDDFNFLLINNVLLDTVNRVASQNSEDKDVVIKKILEYVHTNIKFLIFDRSYKKEKIKRKIIMFFNYHNLIDISQMLLKNK